MAQMGLPRQCLLKPSSAGRHPPGTTAVASPSKAAGKTGGGRRDTATEAIAGSDERR